MTSAADYAIRAMIHLACLADGGVALRSEIAPLTLPANDLSHRSACRTCGAPVVVASLAQEIVVCGYCGTEHLLARRARRARAVAGAQAELATSSLLDATASLEASVALPAR